MPNIAILSYMWLVVVMATWAVSIFQLLGTHWGDGYDAMRGLIFEILSMVEHRTQPPMLCCNEFQKTSSNSSVFSRTLKTP